MNQKSYVYAAQIIRAYGILRQAVVNALVPFGLIPSSWALLGLVKDADGGMTASSASATLGVTLPMITIMADRLVELGYVERVQHATDNRMKYLQTSPYGLERIKKIESEIRKNASPLLRGLGDADMEQLGRILDTIIGNSEAAQ